MITKSYNIRAYEFHAFNGTLQNLPYIYFTSESVNPQFIAKLAREKIMEHPEMQDWHVALIQYYDYETGQYETFSYIHNKKHYGKNRTN